MSITEQDIKSLTPEHRVVWKEPRAPREVEMGLWVDRSGRLWTDAGHVARWEDGGVPAANLNRIVRIIEPPFTPRVGMVIGKPDRVGRRLVRTRDGAGGDPWLGHAPELHDGDFHWFTDADARYLIEDHGWEVVDDLAKEKSDD